MSRPSSYGVQVRVVYRERWRRILVLTGDVDGNLTYNAMGHGETVYWNKRKRAKSSTWSWQVVYPWVEFTLPGVNERIPARIDVGATFMPPWKMGINRFRLSIDGEILFDELYGDYHFGREWGIVTDEPFEEDY